MATKKIILLVLVIALLFGFFLLDARQYLTPQFFRELYQQEPVLTALLFFFIYIAVTGLSLPGAALLTLVGGAIFGLWTGFLLVSFASTIGATLAFLMARFFLRDWVQKSSQGIWGPLTGVSKKMAHFTCSPCAWCPCFLSS